MLHHSAYGRGLEALTVAVIDNRRPMLSMMRAMLAAIGVGRIETYDCPAEAMEAMTAAPPDLVIAAATMQPLTGPAMVRTMRQADAGLLCLIPAMITSAHAKPHLVEESLRAGAHQVLVLPIAASTLYRRLDWLTNDDRPYELHGDHYVVAGLEERLALNFPRPAYTPVPVPARAPLAVADESFAQAMPFALKVRMAS
ncbi:MAG: response regulator [Methyloceanibacter sp.]|nr:response regulator [Methyloceanibacter sp.]